LDVRRRQQLHLVHGHGHAGGGCARQFHGHLRAGAQLGRLLLRERGGDAQLARVVQAHERLARQRHVAQGHGHAGHHAVKRRLHHVQAGLRGGHTSLRLQRLDLRLARLPLRTGVVQRRLADVVFGDKLLLAFVFLGRAGGLGLSGRHLRAAGGGALGRHACVDAQQFLPGLHAVARMHAQRDDAARHLGGQCGIAHRLHLGIAALQGRLRARLHRCPGERRGVGGMPTPDQCEGQSGGEESGAQAEDGHQGFLANLMLIIYAFMQLVNEV